MKSPNEVAYIFFHKSLALFFCLCYHIFVILRKVFLLSVSQRKSQILELLMLS